MNFVSAYLIMQKADSDDPIHPPQDEMPKSWFKEILYNHPLDFPNYLGLEWDLEYSNLISELSNLDYRQEDPERDHFYVTVESIDPFTPQPGYWVTKGNGDYISPGILPTFQNANYYIMMNGSSQIGRSISLLWRDSNGNERHLTEWVVKNASSTVFKQTQGAYPLTESKAWGYAISCKIKVPIFENESDGAAYSAAAQAYYSNPTPENYEAVCHYIDLCNNPNG